MLPFCLNVGLILLPLNGVKLALLPLDLPFEVSALLCLGLLDLGPVLRLLFDLFHHGDLLCLHLRDLLLHRLSFELLLIEGFRQPRLLSLLVLKLLKLGLQFNFLLLILLLDPAFLCIARRLLQ